MINRIFKGVLYIGILYGRFKGVLYIGILYYIFVIFNIVSPFWRWTHNLGFFVGAQATFVYFRQNCWKNRKPLCKNCNMYAVLSSCLSKKWQNWDFRPEFRKNPLYHNYNFYKCSRFFGILFFVSRFCPIKGKNWDFRPYCRKNTLYQNIFCLQNVTFFFLSHVLLF